jgi:TatD DNase family protein
MPLPARNDLIDIHTHGSILTSGQFAVENIMIHEGRVPDDSASAFSVGIHPWFLSGKEMEEHLERLVELASDQRVVAIGEAGYDRRRGPDMQLQQRAFEEQAKLAGELGKPLMIHCVRGWDELWASKLRLKPAVPWIVHGFNGSVEQAGQLVSGGMYLSLWVKSVLNGSLDRVIAEVPAEKIFLETDGFETDLHALYERAAEAAGKPFDEFAEKIRENYLTLFS